MQKLFILSILSLAFVGCSTVGQQITNTNGTVVVNETSKCCGQSTTKVVKEPKATILPVPPPAPKPQPVCCEFDYSYQSVRVVDSYIVVY